MTWATAIWGFRIHVPFVIKWPGVIEPGSVSHALVSQIDLMATLASMLGYDLPDKPAEDAFDLLPVLRGETSISPRTTHVHNTKADHYAIRHGDDVLINASNGYVSERNKGWEKHFGYTDIADGSVQLFDMKNDPSQKQDLAEAQPEKVKAHQALLKTVRERGYPRERILDKP